MLGIVVSLPWELKSLSRQPLAAGEWHLLTKDVLITLSGIGPERAGRAGSLLAGRGATALMSWGCAAALDDRLKAGDLLLPEIILGAGGEVYRIDANWHRRLMEALSPIVPVHTGVLAESNAIVRTPGEKQALARRTVAAATDMESATHARVAGNLQLPFIAVRAVVDTASTEIPQAVLKALDTDGGIDGRQLCIGALRRPSDGLKILRLGRQFRAAHKTLEKIRSRVLQTPPS